jgi:hypothetical protein
MLLGAGFQRNYDGVIVVVLSRIKVGMEEVDVEVPRVRVEVMVPDFYSEHKSRTGHRGNCVRLGIVVASGRNARLDDHFLKGIENLIVECY